MSSCQLSGRLCPSESAAALACAKGKPDSAFHCDAEEQVTIINDGVCTPETDALVACAIDAAF